MIYKILLLTMLLYSSVLNAQVDAKPLNYFSQEEIDLANTAISADYMSYQEKKAFMWMNLARMQPQKFSEVVAFFAKQEYGSSYKSNRYVKSLLKELNKLKSLHALKPNETMFESAKCWALEAGKLGKIGHNRKKCKKIHHAECCGYADENSGFYHLVSLLIDDEVADLGHRIILLSNQYYFAGISIQPHKIYGKNIVINFSRTEKL